MIRLSGLTGILAGSAIAALGFVSSAVLLPPNSSDTSIPDNAAALPPAPVPNDTAMPQTNEAAMPPEAPLGKLDMPERAETMVPAAADDELATPEPSDPLVDRSPGLPFSADAPTRDSSVGMVEATPPALPEPISRPVTSGLPGTPVPPRDAPLPDSPVPPLQNAPQAPEPTEDTAQAISDPAEPRLPGMPVAGLPGTPARPIQTPEAPISAEAEDIAPATALERNSSFAGLQTGGPLMSIILNDPGLPMPLRRSLAALDLPITIALNPMDNSASDAADIYREAGKEVLILANGLPDGARATDLDVTFGAWFDTLPQAVGVLDLPRGGFARNATLTSGVMPLIARDGHGLVSFSGGLSRIAATADSAGVPHEEVFRVLDDEDQSAFTIRRYLDRAVFQASQIGHVIVFGDATNDGTMEALALWRSDGRADQVAVVPISAILLTR